MRIQALGAHQPYQTARRFAGQLIGYAPAVVLAAVAVASWLYFVQPHSRSRNPDPRPPAEPQEFGSLPVIGSPAAAVGIIGYSEFQCPFCGVFARTTLVRIEQEYIATGRVAFAFRHFPLASIHPHAVGAAEVAACASRQGRFREFHDKLFAAQDRLDGGLPAALAQELGLAMPSLRQCLAEQAPAEVRRDVQLGESLGVFSTPTFFVGRVRDGRLIVADVIVGARPFEDFAAVLTRLLRSP